MRPLLKLFALCLSIGLLTFLACRAQSQQPPAPRADPQAAAPDGGVDAPVPPPPDVFLPASKSGGVFLEHQQAPR